MHTARIGKCQRQGRAALNVPRVANSSSERDALRFVPTVIAAVSSLRLVSLTPKFTAVRTAI